jgi:hypothetical protein
MTEKEFKIVFQNLKNRSSWESKFDYGFVNVLWDQIRNYSITSLQKAVEELLGQHTCPTVSEILFLTRKHNYGTRSDYIMAANDCDWCDGFGVVVMVKKDRVSPFQCQKCPNGIKIKEHTAKWSDGSIATVGQGLHIGFEPVDPNLRKKILESFKQKQSKKQRLVENDAEQWWHR